MVNSNKNSRTDGIVTIGRVFNTRVNSKVSFPDGKTDTCFEKFCKLTGLIAQNRNYVSILSFSIKAQEGSRPQLISSYNPIK